MSVFVDTGVFYAHHDTDASRHDVGVAALNRVLRSAAFGRAVTSDYVYDEVVTLTHRRTGRIEDAVELGRRIRGDGYPEAIDVRYLTPTLFDDAVDAYERYSDHGLSFTDATIVAMVDRHDIDSVLSFDDGFDGVIDRLAPETVAGGE
ncbi:type II toxin-antitoxin system VapC family toxin [Halomarina pelagica]|uniref:type II toxin-antitoxin system VapC family toxin n=1 Tax=Halomarina pelagica TaxID=2961599 RepID=UPI0020C5181B|nr:PIN domain-containing protein [Halomarina sp. BND7]